MADEAERPYLSIGEVLGLLLEEFPDVTISKIRFLESQGLIDPERTPAGYRKFYEPDVELLRVILREQRENFLPLRVIKDRIDSGQIDPSGEIEGPGQLSFEIAGADEVSVSPPSGPDEAADRIAVGDPAEGPTEPAEPAVPNERNVRAESTEPAMPLEPAPATDSAAAESPPTSSVPTVAPNAAGMGPSGLVIDRAELCAMAQVNAAEADDLERFGLISGRESGGQVLYDEHAVEIARVCGEFMRRGVDARHLKGWRLSAEREAALFEQLITPRLRQRSPAARAEAISELADLDRLGTRLRAALMDQALRSHRRP